MNNNSLSGFGKSDTSSGAWLANSAPLPPDWWDYTTLDDDIIRDAAALTPEKMLKLSRPGFKVVFYDTLEDFYLAEALEYITAWKQSTPIIRSAFAGRLVRPSNCRWSRGWSTTWA